VRHGVLLPFSRLFLERASLLSGMVAGPRPTCRSGAVGSFRRRAIKVGIATDLTGPISWGGIPNSNIAKMVIDDINASGGLLGLPVQMIVEDTASNEQLAVTRVRKLVTQDKADVVFGGITSSMRNAIKDTIVNRGRTLYIYPQLYEAQPPACGAG
jgi:urea transport system substrate-binding protein